MYKILSASLALSALLVLAGCGGGSDSGSGTSSSTALRAYGVRNYVYSLQGSLTTTADGQQALTASSQRVLRITLGSATGQFNVNAQDSLVVDQTNAGTAFNLLTTVTQGGDRNVSLNVINQTGGGVTPGPDKGLTNSVLFLPGTFTANAAPRTETLQFADGTSATYTFNIGGRERITVAGGDYAGSYNTYVVTSSITFGTNDSRTGTFYYAPEIGTYVRSTETITRPNGTTATFTTNLTTD
jgi:hypothetical protein